MWNAPWVWFAEGSGNRFSIANGQLDIEGQYVPVACEYVGQTSSHVTHVTMRASKIISESPPYY